MIVISVLYMKTKVARFLEWVYVALRIHANFSFRVPDLNRNVMTKAWGNRILAP